MRGEDHPAHKDKMEALLNASRDNKLCKVRGWTPKLPTILYHSVDDEVVPIDNYRSCLDTWVGSPYVKGVKFAGRTRYHVAYGKVFYMVHCAQGIKAILNDTYGSWDFDGTNAAEY